MKYNSRELLDQKDIANPCDYKEWSKIISEGMFEKQADDLNFEMDPLKGISTDEKNGDNLKAKAADGLNWEELRKELRNLFKFNPENRSWGTIVKTSLIIFATSLVPSLFDMGSDAFSVYNYINGATYTKQVPDLNHPSVNSSQCIHVGRLLR